MDLTAYLALSGLLLVITITFVVFIFSERGLANENDFHLTWTAMSLSGVLICDGLYVIEANTPSVRLVSVASYFLLGSSAAGYQVFLTRKTRGLVHRYVTSIATAFTALVSGAFLVAAMSSILYCMSDIGIPKDVPVLATFIGGGALVASDFFFLAIFSYKIYCIRKEFQSNLGDQVTILSLFGAIAMGVHITGFLFYAFSTTLTSDPLFFASRLLYCVGIWTLMAMKVIPIILSNRARREKQLQNATETGVVLATAPLSSV
jgi:hypothetical protein